jgi:folate-dependent phosphoribosylglycinamide formyltransferase PurN
MKLFIISVDEPIYFTPYIEALLTQDRHPVKGVAVYQPATKFSLKRLKRSIALVGIVLTIYSWKDISRLFWYKAKEILHLPTTHRLIDIARKHNIPVQIIRSANDEAFVKQLRDVDVVLNQTPEILKKPILHAPEKAVINRHMAYLPAYRGAFPVFWQFYNNEQEFGVTIHTVDEGIDTGAILVQHKIRRTPKDTIGTAYKRLFAISPKLTLQAIDLLQNNKKKQQTATPSYFRNPGFKELFTYWWRRLPPHL